MKPKVEKILATSFSCGQLRLDMNSLWFLIVVLLVKFSFLVNGAEKSEVCHNEKSNYDWSPYYQILLAAVNNVTAVDKCTIQIQSIASGLNEGELWALKAFDASGTVPSGFLYGQIFWRGSEQACDLLNGEINPLLSAEYKNPMTATPAPIPMKYYTIYASYQTPNQIKPFSIYDIPLQIGVCLPRSCNSHIILHLSKEVFSKNTLRFQQFFNITMDIFDVRDSSLTKFFQNFDTIVILAGLFTVIGFVILMNFIRQQKENDNVWYRFANCFDITRNFDNLMDTSTPVGTVSTISGIKSLVCLSIMLMHLTVFSMFTFNNMGEMYYYYGNVAFIIIFMSVLYVDAFFVTSAFLLTYNFLRNEKQIKIIESSGIWQNLKLFLKNILHRYIRLTPALLMTMALTHLTSVYMKEATQIYTHEYMDLYCTRNSWWRGILYIQNFYTMDEMCGLWTWYLSAEMIYYIITLMGLFAFVKYQRLTKWLYVCLSTLLVFYSLYRNYEENFTGGFDIALRTRNTLYIANFVRMNPFFAGILGAYLMHKYQNFKLKITKRIYYTWILIEVFSVTIMFMLTKYFIYFPNIVMQLGNSIGRYYFGCLVVYTIFINNFDYDSPIKRFLSHRFFTHLNKLTYMMYLVYPVVVVVYRALSDSNISTGFNISFIEGLGTTVICYFSSIILTLFCEIPFCRVSNEFLRKRTKNVGHLNQVNSLRITKM